MNAWSELRALPKEQWVLALATLVNRTGTMALAFLVLYTTKNLGFSVEQSGAILATYGVAALVSAFLGGELSDRFGASRVAIVSLFLSSILMIAYPFARSFESVIVLTFLWSLISEVYRPAGLSLTAEHAAPEQRKTAFALSRLAINLGMSIGPPIGGFLAESSFASLFYIDGVTTFLGGVILWIYFRHRPSPVSTEKRTLVSFSQPLRDKRLMFFLLASLPVNLVFFQTTSTMALFFVDDLKLRESTYGLLSAINTVLIIFIEVPLNLATQRWRHRSALAVGSALFGIGFCALVWARSIPALALTIVIWSFGEMVMMPQASAYVSDIAPNARRGSYMGLYTMTFAVAFIIGPWLGTYIYQHKGPLVLWAIVGGWGFLSALCFLGVKEPEPQEVA